MRFTRAIVRKPCRNMVHGLSTSGLGKPDYKKAMVQHASYIDALLACGLEVIVLDADENFPDSTFVEDTALLTPRCAVITLPATASRKDEIKSIEPVIRDFYQQVEHITAPGTLEAGDVMIAGDHYYIGLSRRTNRDGAMQLLSILDKYGMSGSLVTISESLHLKSGIAYLEDETIAVSGECVANPAFSHYRTLVVPGDEGYAANCIWINGHILLAAGFKKTKKVFEQANLRVKTIAVSEFRKLDGGLSCLSLRF